MKKTILLLSCFVGLQAFAATSIEPGTPYYMRNVATGKYLTAGGWWGTHAVVGDYGLPVTFEDAGSGSYRARTPLGYFQGKDIYIDKPINEGQAWSAVSVDGGKAFAFTYQTDGTEVAVSMDGDWYINQKNADISNAEQQWVILTKGELVEQLNSATMENPMNATFLLPGSEIIRNCNEFNEKWKRVDAGANARFEIAQSTPDNNDGNANYNMVYRSYNEATEDAASTAYTIVNSATGFPNGSYILTGFVVSDGAYPVLTVNGVAVEYQQAGEQGSMTPLQFGNAISAGQYKIGVPVTVSDGTFEIKFVKEAGEEASVLYFDKFEIQYLGENAGNPYDVLYKNVKDAMVEAQVIADRLNITFDNSEVEKRWENHTITGDGTAEVHMTYEALAAACKAQENAPADMTYAILNPSFELGSWGWSFGVGGNTRVENVKDNPTDGADGDYLFNTWLEGGKGKAISQTLGNMPAGTYNISAKVFAPNGATLYLVVNDQHQAIKFSETRAGDTFRTVSMKYSHSQNGDMTIGIAGGDENGEFVSDNGSWYRADNFTLTYDSKYMPTSVETLIVDTVDMPAEYYNLQGIRIAEPVRGEIYIVKKGTEVKKVYY